MKSAPTQNHISINAKSNNLNTISYLEPALWKSLTTASSAEEYCQYWLGLQCRIIEQSFGGIICWSKDPASAIVPIASFPHDLKNQPRFAAIVEKVIEEKKGFVLQSDPEGAQASPHAPSYYLAYPLHVLDALRGVATIEISRRPSDQLQAAMRQLQWGVAWLENWLLKEGASSSEQARKRLALALELTAIALQEDRFSEASQAFVTELASRLECDRVSLGFACGNQVKVATLSYSAQFGKQMNLVRAIGSAMDESLDQGKNIVYPELAGQENIIREHDLLAKEHGSGSIMTLPFLKEGESGYGAITLERPANNNFSMEEVLLCQAVVGLVGPILAEKRQNDRNIFLKVLDSLRGVVQAITGPGHPVLKLVTVSILAVVLFFSFAEGDYRVTGKATLEGAVQRAVTAPIDGFLDDAPARAGDIIEKDTLLARLDDRDLNLERFKWASQKEQYMFEYHKAMSEGEIAASKILLAQVNQAEAQIWLLDEQLSRTTIKAPIAGLIVSGDHSQALGSPVQQGQLLYEIAPLNAYRVVLEVDEWEIEQVQNGQPGKLVLSAMPDEPFAFEVTNVTPVTVSKEGQTYFEVEAALQQSSNRLRPGMVGYGKVTVEKRLLIWIWTHDMIDWLRLRLWAFIP